jgi:hypothetical protein
MFQEGKFSFSENYKKVIGQDAMKYFLKVGAVADL